MRSALAAALGSLLALAACRGPRSRPDTEITAEPADASADLVIALADDGTSRVDGAQVPLSGLGAAARTLAARASTVLVEAPATTGWGRVIAVLDAVKSAGVLLPYVFSVRGDAAHRTGPIQLPKAATSGSGQMDLFFPGPGSPTPRTVTSAHFHHVTLTRESALLLDGVAPTEGLASSLGKLGDLREAAVVLQADTAAPFGSIVDVVAIVQRAGAPILFGVAPIAMAPAEARTGATQPPGLPPGALARCPFPAQASRDRIDEGAATIRVGVGADGKVTDVKVVKDDGHGFGAAAEAYARRVAFTPARDAEGRAIAGERTLRVHFVPE